MRAALMTFGLFLAAGTARGVEPQSTDADVWAKVAQASQVMWRDFIDPHTFQVYTYLDPGTRKPIFPTPALLADPRPNPGGWNTAIENCSLDGGVYLGGLVDRYAVTGKPDHAEEARKIYQGLRLIAQAAQRKGCIPRGVMPDQKTHMPESSVDQYTMYVYGLWRYYRSPIPTESEKDEIRVIFDALLKRLQQDNFVILTDTGGPTRFGDLDRLMPSRAERLLAILLAGADITGDPHWRTIYTQMREPRLKHCRGLGGQPWVLVQNQCAFFILRHLEQDPRICNVYETSTLEAAQNCVPWLSRCASATEQKEFLEKVVNPLEGALAIALTEDRDFIAQHLSAIKRVITTFDYSAPRCGKTLFVNGVRPVECIAWSLARQGLLSPG